jgi:hypothetical protein
VTGCTAAVLVCGGLPLSGTRMSGGGLAPNIPSLSIVSFCKMDCSNSAAALPPLIPHSVSALTPIFLMGVSADTEYMTADPAGLRLNAMLVAWWLCSWVVGQLRARALCA